MSALSANLALPFTGIFISLAVFLFGQFLFKKSGGFFLFHPLLVGSVTGILLLVIWGKLGHMTTAAVYNKYFLPGGNIINWFLQPATIAFAIPLYKRNDVVKKYWKEIILALVAGSFVAMFAILAVAKLLGLSRATTIAMLPQAATLAIATQITTSLGGQAAITSLACILNAVIIYAAGDILIKAFRLDKSDIGLGLGLGTAGHTVGSAKAVELGSVQGAMASIAVVIIGLIMNFIVPVFVNMFM